MYCHAIILLSFVISGEKLIHQSPYKICSSPSERSRLPFGYIFQLSSSATVECLKDNNSKVDGVMESAGLENSGPFSRARKMTGPGDWLSGGASRHDGFFRQVLTFSIPPTRTSFSGPAFSAHENRSLAAVAAAMGRRGGGPAPSIRKDDIARGACGWQSGVGRRLSFTLFHLCRSLLTSLDWTACAVL